MVWFLGRVARHRSAKPSTAVRIRQEPQWKTAKYYKINNLAVFLVKYSKCDYFVWYFVKLPKVENDLETTVCESIHGGVRGWGSNSATYLIDVIFMVRYLEINQVIFW